MNDGWIKLHRSLMSEEWEWFGDTNTTYLFICLILLANHKDGNWKGIPIKRGSLITGLKSLQKKTGLSIQNIRTSLSKLEKSQKLTNKSTNKYRVISIKNYNQYQETNNQLTINQQTTNKQLTTNKKEKKEKNEKNTVVQEPLKKEAEEWLEHYRVVRKEPRRKSTRSFIKNFVYWRKTYSLNEMKEAVSRAKLSKFFNDAMTPDFIFRTKNRNGECDYIGDLLNIKIPD